MSIERAELAPKIALTSSMKQKETKQGRSAQDVVHYWC